MNVLTKVRARWAARRRDLAYKQLEAERNTPDPSAIGHTDMMTTGLFMHDQALGKVLNPKAKTKSEWKGD